MAAPVRIALVSTSDTDLLSARASGVDYTVANPSRDAHQQMGEAIASADLVVARILGSPQDLCSGFERIVGTGVPTVVLGGEQTPNAELMERSTVPVGVAAEAHRYLAEGGRFHDIIAWSSENALFGYVVESLLGILDGTVVGLDYPRHSRAAVLEAHQGIYAALAARDPEASEQRMRDHVAAYEQYAERKFPQVLSETIPWDQRYFG